MNIDRREISENVELLIGRFSDEEESLLQQFTSLQEFLRTELSLISNNRRRLEILGEYILLKDYFGVEKKIQHEENGKPYINDKHLKISISHSSHDDVIVAIIIGDADSVGIDIERKRPTLFRVKHKFLSEKEQEWVAQLPTNQQLDVLALCWCAKETVFKMMPKSLPDFADEIAIEPFEISSRGTMEVWADTKGENRKLMLEYELTEEFAMTYSVVKN